MDNVSGASLPGPRDTVMSVFPGCFSPRPGQDSVAMAHDLARARLLTVAGYGHTEANNPSNCALGYEIS